MSSARNTTTVPTIPVDKTEDVNLYIMTTGASVSQASLDPTVKSMWMNAECIATLAATEENVSTLLDHISKSMLILKILMIIKRFLFHVKHRFISISIRYAMNSNTSKDYMCLPQYVIRLPSLYLTLNVKKVSYDFLVVTSI